MQSSSNLYQALLKFLSRFTDRKIPGPKGVSTDDNLVLSSNPTAEQIEKAQRQTKAVYRLRDPDEVGGFEMDGQVIRGDKSLIKVRHTRTQEILLMPKRTWELLFEKEKP